MHIARIFQGTYQFVFFLLRSVSFLFFLIDGSYYPWTYSLKEHARRTTCLYEIYSKIVFNTPSLRKADAKVQPLRVTTKQKDKYFSEYFVNKYNSLNMTTADKNKRGGVIRHHLFYIRTCA